MENRSLTFETLNPTRLFFRCAIPAMCSMAFTAFYTIADGIFVGRFIGEEALAAVNLAMPLVMISFALADMIAVGSSVQIAMFLGQKNKEAANRTFSFSVCLTLLISVLAGLFFWFFAQPILRLIGTEGPALQYGIAYMRVYAFFSPLTMIFFATDNYLRICGRQKYSMILNIGTAVLNIVLDYLFIVVLGQGVWSAALASCISIGVGSIFSVLPFVFKKVELRFTWGSISLRQFGKMLANGSSEFFNNISESILAFILNIVLLDLGGTTAVAAVSIVMYIESLVSTILFGMCDSMQPPLSYCHGAGLQKRVHALEKRVLFAATLLSFGACMFLRYGGSWIIPFFAEPGDTALLELTGRAMELYALSYLVNWIDGCLSGYLTALGKSVKSFVVSICGTLLFPLIGLAVLVPAMNLDGVFLMPLFAGILSGILSIFLVARK